MAMRLVPAVLTVALVAAACGYTPAGATDTTNCIPPAADAADECGTTSTTTGCATTTTSPPTTPPADGCGTTTTVPATTTTGPIAPIVVWEAVAASLPDVGDDLHLAPGPGGVVAWGNALHGSTGDAAIAFSADGVTWEQPVRFPGHRISGVAAGGTGYVAVGGRYLEPAGAAEARFAPAAWWSEDGRAWHPAEVVPAPEIAATAGAWAEPLGRAPAGAVTGARATPDIPVIEGEWLGGLVADGEQMIAFGSSPATGRRNVLWTSRDGRTWQEVAGRPFGDGDADVRGIAAGATGYAAWGSRETFTHAPGSLVTWWSADGLAWQRAPAAPGFEDGPLVAGLVPHAGGFALVGSAWMGPQLAWLSPDGRAWGDPAPLPLPEAPGTFLRELAANGEVLVAIGRSSPPDGSAGTPVLVQSFDGVAWERVDPGLLAGGRRWTDPVALAWVHDRWLAVGYDWPPEGDRLARAWVGR